MDQRVAGEKDAPHSLSSESRKKAPPLKRLHSDSAPLLDDDVYCVPLLSATGVSATGAATGVVPILQNGRYCLF